MSFSSGDRLGRYEVLGPLGAGGMGEIFTARDTELDRQVAIKVLPHDFAADSSRIERFQREARALAALSHPNLLEVYDVGSSNGVHYVVTELLEGQTLRERVPTGGLPWQKVAEMGAPMAEGLAAAHSRGIIHRDLKPENIFITSDGRIKILDFGLAKVLETVEPEAETGTMTPAGTAMGTILGTMGYMSPEQVKGQPVDQRSDIFSLGCVLYEMVSGRRAFASDTAAEIIASVLKEEPLQLSSTGAELPVDLERAIHRCLEKEPAARFQSAADLGFALRTMSSSPTRPVMATPSGDVAVRSGSKRMWVGLAAAVAVVVIGLLAWWQLAPDDRPAERAPEVARVAKEDKVVFVTEHIVIVEEFENRSVDPSMDPVAAAMTTTMQGAVDQLGFESIPVSELDQAALRVKAPSVAGIVITGSYTNRGDDVEVAARLVDLKSRRALWTSDPILVRPTAVSTDLAPLISRISSAVLIWEMDFFPLEHVSHVPELEVFRLFAPPGATGVFEYFAGFDQYLGRALENDPKFVPAVYMAYVRARHVGDRESAERAIAAVRQHNPNLTNHEERALRAAEAALDGDLVTAFDLIRKNQEQNPHNLWWRHERAFYGLMMNALKDVLTTVDAIDFTSIGNDPPAYWEGLKLWLAHAYAGLGKYEKLLEMGRRAQAANPSEVPGEILPALAGLGRFDELDQELTRLESRPGGVRMAVGVMLETSAFLAALGHENKSVEVAERSLRFTESVAESDRGPSIKFARLEALALAGRWEEMEVAARELLADPTVSAGIHELARFLLGVAAAHLGRTDEARMLLDEYQNQREWANATGIAAHLGELDLALDLFRHGLADGDEHYYGLKKTLAYLPLWGYPPWEEFVAPR